MERSNDYGSVSVFLRPVEFAFPDGCIYNNAGVVCRNHNNCYRCGWNKAISDLRARRIREILRNERKVEEKAESRNDADESN